MIALSNKKLDLIILNVVKEVKGKKTNKDKGRGN